MSMMGDRQIQSFGELISSLRALSGKTQEELAEDASLSVRVTAAASLTAAAPAAARMALRELTTASLLTEHSAGRYAFHDLLRVYAAEHSPTIADEDGRAAAGRMLDHYLCNARTAALLISPSRQPITIAPPRAGVWLGQLSSHQQAMAWFETAARHASTSRSTGWPNARPVTPKRSATPSKR